MSLPTQDHESPEEVINDAESLAARKWNDTSRSASLRHVTQPTFARTVKEATITPSSHSDVASEALRPANLELSASLIKESQLHLNWKTSNPFANEPQRQNFIKFHKQVTGQDRIFPEIFKHGVHFEPGPAERNVHRTVQIGNLKHDVTMAELLEQIRGGRVVDAKLSTLR